MQYFNLNGFQGYKNVVKEKYSAASPAAHWIKETRDKLEYLVDLLSSDHNLHYQIVYREKPNGQGGTGKIIFKEYVLIGFAPDDSSIGDDLFIKLEFGKLDSQPVFNINLDLNFRKATSPFINERNKIYSNTYKEYPVDENFPRNWEDLVTLISSDLLDLKTNYYNTLRSLDLSMETEKLINLLKYKKQIILQGPPGTGKTKLAIELAEQLTGIKNDDFVNSDQCEIIQFHPSYSYEDFVQGIVVKPNPDGDGLLYEPENKLLGEFAEKALKNYRNAQIAKNKLQNPNNQLNQFLTEIIDLIDQSPEGKYPLTENVYIYQVEEKRLKYKGDNWTAHPNGLNMNIAELEKIINLGIRERSEITKETRLNSLTRQHATYFVKFLEKFDAFTQKNDLNEKIFIEELKNYVLIIDEINRANLSSVLGELIYTLEYRGKAVNSIYGEDKLVLPENLYIIGTMNTADRSVGHIDYAIRRRFAFVEVSPNDLSSEMGKDFHSNLFNNIKELFLNGDNTKSDHLSPEFDAKDVQLGHSYFIQHYEKDLNGKNILEKPIDFKLRLDYEIKPILYEYVKDGILKKSALDIINSLTC